MNKRRKEFFNRNFKVCKKFFLTMLLKMKIKMNLKGSRNWRKNSKFKRRRRKNTENKKKEDKRNCWVLKRIINLLMKKFNIWKRDSDKSRLNMLLILKSWKIFKTSTKMRRNSYSIPSENNKNKSRNFQLFCLFSWVRSNLTTLSLTPSGMKRKKSGPYPALHIRKRIWGCPSCQARLLEKIQKNTMRRRRKRLFLSKLLQRKYKRQDKGSGWIIS